MADTIEIVQGTATVVEVAGPTGPQGPSGAAGSNGEAATVTVGTVTTGAAGSSASVTNTGTSSAAVLAFTIPRGDKGEKGDTGDTGPAGTTDYNALTNKPTLGTAASKDTPATGNATSGQVVLGSDTRLSDTRTPTDGTVTDAKITSGGLSTSSLNWAAIADWAPSTSYAKGDLVNYLGVAYRRSAAGTSGTTFSSANWQQITPSTGSTASTLAAGNHTHTSFSSLRIDPNDGSVGSLTVGSTTGSQTDVVKLNSAGVVLLNQSGNGATTIGRGGGSSNYTLTPPSASGTIALTSDIPTTFAASAITSGTLDNARINWAAPGSIGSTTASSGAFTTLSANNGTLTASAPVLDLSQTWNNAAVTFTGLKLNVTNTASAAASLFESIQLAGNQFYELDSSRAIRLYNTSSSSNANYERGFMRWSSNVLQIGTEKAGTGSARALEFQTDSTTRLVLSTSGLVQFAGTTSSFPALKRSSTTLQVRLADDAAFAPLEASGLTLTNTNTFTVTANATSNLVGGAAVIRLDGVRLAFATGGTDRLAFSGGGDATFASASLVQWLQRTRLSSPADGQFLVANSAGTDFDRVQLGGTTSSFPAIKRSSAILQARLADDSGYTVLDAQLRAQGTAPATSGATGTAGDIRYDADYIYICTAANTWKRVAIATW